jgi:protein-tyrosine phosphatase
MKIKEINDEYFEQLTIEGMPGNLYRSQMPMSLYDDSSEYLVPAWIENEITHVVCMQMQDEMERYTAMNLPIEYYQEFGLKYIWHPTPDHHGSDDTEKLLTDARFVYNLMSKKVNVVIHCHAGIGRTGMFIAAMLISAGFNTQQAVNSVRKSSKRLKYSINKMQYECLIEVENLAEALS